MNNFFLVLAAAAFCGCASFNSGDVKVRRDTAAAMLADKSITPFAELQVSWQGFPYRAPTDSIGEGSASKTKTVKPVPADPGDLADFAEEARDIFKEAGLYDPARGRGALRLELTTFGKWNYGDLFRSFLVDTGFIFIIPASLRVNYFLTADFAVRTGPVRVETEGRNKTTFHLLMAPLYPFFAPGARENGLLRQMLWRSATDVYGRLKETGGVPAPLPPGAKDSKKPAAIAGPPVPPDRTWLPGQEPGASGETAPITPEAPDKTWVVPAAEKHDAPPPADPIKPAEADRSWETRTAPEETPDD